MAENPIAVPPTPITKPTPIVVPSLFNRLVDRVKSDRKILLALILFMITFAIAIAASLILNTQSQKIGYQEGQISQPSPSPAHQTRFVNHPTIIQAEEIVNQTQADIKSFTIQKHPLLPPALDMQVTLDK